MPAAQSAAILADAAWGVYLYRTLRVAYEEATTRVIGYANAITDGDNGSPAPAAPAMPELAGGARDRSRCGDRGPGANYGCRV